MTNNQNLPEIGESVQKTAKHSSSEQISCSDLSQLNMKNDEISQVFEVLLKKLIQNQKAEHSQIKVPPNHILDKVAPTLCIKSSVIGILCSLLLAAGSKLIGHSKLIFELPAYVFFLLISFFFIAAFVILWDLELLKRIKSLQEQIEEKFNNLVNKAATTDWKIVEEITKKAKFKANVIEYNINTVNHSIEIIQDREKTSNKEIKLVSFSIIIIVILMFDPYKIMDAIKRAKDIPSITTFVAFLSVVAASFNFLLELIREENLQFEISKWKECLYCLKQAQLIVSDIEANKS